MGVSHGARTALIAVVAVIGLIVIVLLVFSPGLIPGIGKPGSVVVTGTVTATGTGAVPEKITFTGTHSGNPYVAACTGGGIPHRTRLAFQTEIYMK